MDKISVIVPVYNAAAYIKRCIESILNQTYQNIELILVDDGSTDGSSIICDEYRKKENIKIVHKKNGGVSSARNAGLMIASGDYIGFVDSDDYIEKNMFQLMHDNIKDADLSMCGYYQNKKKFIGISNKQIVDRTTAVTYVIGDGGFKGFLWNKLFKKSVIDKYKIRFFPDIHMCEDLVFCISYIDKIEKVCLLPNALYYYEDCGVSLSNAKFNQKKYSVIKAYNTLLSMDLIKGDKKIFKIVENRKIKHCLSLWMLLVRDNLMDKNTYFLEIKREIKHENISFLMDKSYGVKYKLLFLILKLF